MLSTATCYVNVSGHHSTTDSTRMVKDHVTSLSLSNIQCYEREKSFISSRMIRTIKVIFPQTKSTCEIVQINFLAQNSEACTLSFGFGYSRRFQRTFHTLPWRAGGGEQQSGAFLPVWGSERTCSRRQAARNSCTASHPRPCLDRPSAAASGIWPIEQAQSCPKCGEIQVG